MAIHRQRHNTTNITRRVTLQTGPQISPTLGTYLCTGLDVYGFQYQIDLTVLPVGVTLDMVQAGQVWFIERRTTFNRLFMYVGEMSVSTIQGVTVSGIPQPGEVLTATSTSGATWITPSGSSSGNATSLQGRPISATAPGSGQVLEWNGASWIPATISISGGGGGSGITQLTGDVTAGPGSGTQAATLQATSNVESIISNNSSVVSISGSLSTISGITYQNQASISTISGEVTLLSGSISTISGTLSTISGITYQNQASINSISGALTTVSGIAFAASGMAYTISGQLTTVSGLAYNANTTAIAASGVAWAASGMAYTISGYVSTLSGYTYSTLTPSVNSISGALTTVSGVSFAASGMAYTISGYVSTLSGYTYNTLTPSVNSISGALSTVSGVAFAASGMAYTISGQLTTVSGFLKNYLPLTGGTVGGLTVSGSVTISGSLTVSGTILTPLLQGASEVVVINSTTALSGTNPIVMTASSGAFYYNTLAPSGSYTISITGAPTVAGRSSTFALLVNNGSTAYLPSGILINGLAANSGTQTVPSGNGFTYNSITTYYQGGTVWSTADTSQIDSYTFTVICTATGSPNSYTLLAGLTKF